MRARNIFFSLLLALSSCKQSKEPSSDSPANESALRLENQKKDLAKFMSDFDEAMNAKYADPGIVPELENTDIFKIEGTKFSNYNFHLTLHQINQLEFVKKELHRLILVHGVETINFLVKPKFEAPRSERENYLGSWRLAKDGTESRSSNMKSRENRERVLERIKQRLK